MNHRKKHLCSLLAVLVTVFFGVGQAGARAAFQTFTAQGTFIDGSTLNGTVSIDTTLGQVTAAQLTVSQFPQFTLNAIQDQGLNLGFEQVLIGTSPGLGVRPFMGLVFPTNTLVDYTGGPLRADSDPNPISNFAANQILVIPLATGVLTPNVAPVPEPSSLILATAAAIPLGLGYWWTRRRRAAA